MFIEGFCNNIKCFLCVFLKVFAKHFAKRELKLFSFSMKSLILGPEIFFDPSTAHTDLKISEQMDEITAPTHTLNEVLKNHNAILGILSVTDLETKELKLGVMFDILENIKDHSPLFEITFLEKNQLFNEMYGYYSSASSRLSILGRRCTETSNHICLVVNRQGVTYTKTEISSSNNGTYIGVITMTKQFKDVVFHFSDKELICKLLLKIPIDNIFKRDTVSLFGVMEKDRSARVILSVIRHDRNIVIFDEKMCYKKLYTSGDGKAIANYNVGSQFMQGGADYKVYRGVLGNIAFKKNSKGFPANPAYFEVQFHFDGKLRNRVSDDTLFEFGLTPRNLMYKHKVLKYHSDAIMVTISRCKPLLFCVHYWQEGKPYKTYTDLHHSMYIPGKYKNEFESYLHQFGITIDPHKHRISIYWIDKEKKHIHDFVNVSFSRSLYPVFGLTDKPILKVKLLSNLIVRSRRSNSCM